MASALIIIDVQYDFCEGGSLAIPRSNEILSVINSIRENPIFDYIYVSQDWHPENHVSFQINNPGSTLFQPHRIQETGELQMMWPVHCVQKSHGAKLHRDLVVKPSDIKIRKGTNSMYDSYSVFGHRNDPTNILADLKAKNVSKVYTCGLAFDYCVGYTAFDAALNGYGLFRFETFVVLDATKPVSESTADETKKKLVDARVQFIESYEL